MAPARKPPRHVGAPPVRIGPSSDDAHEVVYFRRHRLDDPDEAAPGGSFLNGCPPGVRAKFRAVLAAVAAAPPKRFAGGGMWEPMKGDLTGWFDVQVDGPGRHHYRLFCRLDYEAKNGPKPLLVVIAGLDKQFRTELSPTHDAKARALGEEYSAWNPRSIA